jgi:hypothetical protein
MQSRSGSEKVAVVPALDGAAASLPIQIRTGSLLPAGRELIGVLGVIVFAVHSWSIRGFLFSLPSFILKYRPDQILAVFCYHMAFALLESMCAMTLLLVLSALLPQAWLRKGFAYKGFVLVAAACAAAIFLPYSYVSENFVFEGPGRDAFLAEFGAGLAAFVALYVACLRSLRLQNWLTSLVDRISIMLYIYIPLDAVGLLVVSARLLR